MQAVFAHLNCTVKQCTNSPLSVKISSSSFEFMTLICFPFLHSRGAVLAKSFLSLADIVLTFRVPFNCRFSVTCQTIESWRYFDLFKSLPFDALTVFSTMALFDLSTSQLRPKEYPDFYIQLCICRSQQLQCKLAHHHTKEMSLLSTVC